MVGLIEHFEKIMRSGKVDQKKRLHLKIQFLNETKFDINTRKKIQIFKKFHYESIVPNMCVQ